MSGSNSFGRAVKAAPEDAAALSFAVHSMPTPDVVSRRTLTGRLQMLLVLLVCAAPVAASYYTYFVVRPQGRMVNYSELISPQRPIPMQLPLADLEGRPVSASSLKGEWMLVVVSGGACDARCEQHLWIQRQLREALGRDKDRFGKLWLIDDDVMPRAETLRAVQHIDGSVPATVLRAPRAALAAWLQPAPGDELEHHMYIVDPVGNWMMRVPVDPDPTRLKADIGRLLRASGVWVRPGL